MSFVAVYFDVLLLEKFSMLETMHSMKLLFNLKETWTNCHELKSALTAHKHELTTFQFEVLEGMSIINSTEKITNFQIFDIIAFSTCLYVVVIDV